MLDTFGADDTDGIGDLQIGDIMADHIKFAFAQLQTTVFVIWITVSPQAVAPPVCGWHVHVSTGVGRFWSLGV